MLFRRQEPQRTERCFSARNAQQMLFGHEFGLGNAESEEKLLDNAFQSSGESLFLAAADRKPKRKALADRAARFAKHLADFKEAHGRREAEVIVNIVDELGGETEPQENFVLS